MRVALVHDWLNQIGGAEDVLDVLVGMFPDAPVYTSIYAPEKMPAHYAEWDIRTNWLDRLPAIHDHHQPYLPLYPSGWAGLDLSAYDLVLTNKSGFCHGVHTGEATHICYCLSPTRYVWQYDHYAQRESLSPALNAILQPVIALLRRWDYAAAQRVDRFIAISSAIQRRIARYYDRDSVIIYPPVETARFTPATTTDDYFLVVSRLIPYKRVDLAVQAATRLGLPLKVAGSGRDRDRLEEMAGPTVEFLGFVPDADLPDLFARAKAFIFPGLEDFGIAPVQAQAAGRPVIAFKGGGALDTVLPGQTGLYFEQQTVEALAAAMQQAAEVRWQPGDIRQHALQFDESVFTSQLMAFIERTVNDGT